MHPQVNWQPLGVNQGNSHILTQAQLEMLDPIEVCLRRLKISLSSHPVMPGHIPPYFIRVPALLLRPTSGSTLQSCEPWSGKRKA